MKRIGAILALLAAAPAYGQLDAAAGIRKSYDDCVYASAAEYLKDPRVRDMSAVAEQSFLACQTEERAILTFLRLNQASAAQAETTIISIRLRIKATLRDIAANPGKYAK